MAQEVRSKRDYKNGKIAELRARAGTALSNRDESELTKIIAELINLGRNDLAVHYEGALKRIKREK
ncbi:MAG: hypothetical protein GSR82_06030 [Desulfurococcales archaeon]|nr:hypothetical protein [Desulfurococcales archaeon]